MDCWEIRGCDDEMMNRCPHYSEITYSPCPPDCRYTDCARPQHKIATDVALLLDPNVDRSAVNKESCRFCVYFLKNGSRLNNRAE